MIMCPFMLPLIERRKAEGKIDYAAVEQQIE
jgi:hypothetical protein